MLGQVLQGSWQQTPMPKALKDHHKRTDLLIGGAGFAGLALAIALRQGLEIEDGKNILKSGGHA